jgi:preprotein translocase subunit SecD
VYLDPKVILDLRDVKRTYAEVDSSSSPISYPVYIELTPDGSAKLSAYSKANIHTRIGIIVDRKLLAAPMIQGHIRSGLLPLPYSSSKEEAEQLVGEISKALMK